jgi:carbonic anhydrase/acetyltransferase-like protein (isoleucine patch superfamily)
VAIYEIDGARPSVAPEAWVAPSAILIGRVEIEAEASVWWGSVLRGDSELIRIGAGANIQDNSTLHTDPGFILSVGARVTVGHAAILHGCTVGAGALVGMGARVLNGAKIGEKAIVGAHALVPEGREIPPGTLAIGAPAKVVRDLTEEEIAHLEVSAQGYIDRARAYANGLKAL